MRTERLSGKLALDGYGEADDILFCGSTPVARWADEHVPPGSIVSLRYWITNREVSLEEAQRASVERLFGKAHIDWGAHYSEITGYLWTDEAFVVGGHDMIRRLTSAVGKHLHLEVEVQEQRAS